LVLFLKALGFLEENMTALLKQLTTIHKACM
jgi:hypothetical protein